MVSNFYCKEYIFYSTYPSDGRFLGFRSQNISKLFAAFAFAQEIEFKTVWSSTEPGGGLLNKFSCLHTSIQLLNLHKIHLQDCLLKLDM